MSTDRKGTKILARTFFAQMRTGGYSNQQILDIASELIGAVTEDLEQASVVEIRPQAEVKRVNAA